LWKETRTALFHQSVDAEGLRHPREPAARVWFGDSWVKESVGELFRENVLRFRPLLGCESEDDPVDLLERGEMPPLRALQLHNGTVYRWNRPCYGVHDGKAHLRIECRYLPAGPTVIDEVANAALWIGAMVGGREVFGDVSERMSFETSRANFIAAARLGLDAGFKWLDGERIDAMHLVRERIIPAARSGLRELGIDETDADRYLDVIEHRTASGRTGADWIIEADLALRGRMSSARRMSVISAALDARAGEEKPVHEWAPLDGAEWIGAFARVEHCMTTDLFTLREDDAVDLAAFIMDDRGVRQILVEDGDQQLVGVISYRSVLHLLASGRLDALSSTVPVREIMVRDPATVRPETPTLEALRLLQDRNVTALPVTRDGRLVGILSERDLLPILASFFEARENAPAEDS
jgi:CBS domain-containing protein